MMVEFHISARLGGSKKDLRRMSTEELLAEMWDTVMGEAEDMSHLQKLRPNLSKLASTGRFCWSGLPKENQPPKSGGTKMENLCIR